MPSSTLVFVGLGSNQGDSISILQSALHSMRSLAVDSELQCSSFYKTQPQGPQEQPDFINAVAGFTTFLAAHELLKALQEIEQLHHRQRSAEQWGPRTLDLDILLYNEQKINTETLMIPHPRMHERLFVLQPLADIDPTLNIPELGRVDQLLQHCENLRIEKVVFDA